jgi:hypothetical protein
MLVIVGNELTGVGYSCVCGIISIGTQYADLVVGRYDKGEGKEGEGRRRERREKGGERRWNTNVM